MDKVVLLIATHILNMIQISFTAAHKIKYCLLEFAFVRVANYQLMENAIMIDDLFRNFKDSNFLLY